MDNLVTPEWVQLQVERIDNIVIIDTRFDLFDEECGYKECKKSHIPNAVYLDVNNDLSGKVQKHGGTHPLPDVSKLALKLGEIGINEQTKVVIYDQTNNMFALRAWWLLYYMGHEKIFIIDGGFEAWKKSGYEVTNEISNIKQTVFTPQVKENIIVDINYVKNKVVKGQSILIDSRSKERYLGIEEPMYHKAGHIPGAKNFFWGDVLDEDGKWKDGQSLTEHFSGLAKTDEIIVSCGSGISACPNVLALKRIGFSNVKLYAGSFSDWISYPENNIETKEE